MEGPCDIFQTGVDSATASGLDFLLIGALKLHALREEHRALLGKDYLDILTLIRRNGMDTTPANFRKFSTDMAHPLSPSASGATSGSL